MIQYPSKLPNDLINWKSVYDLQGGLTVETASIEFYCCLRVAPASIYASRPGQLRVLVRPASSRIELQGWQLRDGYGRYSSRSQARSVPVCVDAVVTIVRVTLASILPVCKVIRVGSAVDTLNPNVCIRGGGQRLRDVDKVTLHLHRSTPWGEGCSWMWLLPQQLAIALNMQSIRTCDEQRKAGRQAGRRLGPHSAAR